GQPTHGLHLLRLPELFLEATTLGDVAEEPGAGVARAVVPVDRCGMPLEGATVDEDDLAAAPLGRARGELRDADEERLRLREALADVGEAHVDRGADGVAGAVPQL